MGWRFATAEDRETVIGQVVDAAEAASLTITPSEFAFSPTRFRRGDGTSHFRPQHATVFTSEELLAAEDRLLARAESRTAPTVSTDVIARVCQRKHHGHHLSDEQATALNRVAASARQLDLLIGPAGAGKTTAMYALRRAWEAEHGRGSVVGLAPSAAAAKVLADDLGIDGENTTKWLHEHVRGTAGFRPGQMVIIDEATLAGTLSLDRLTGLAEAAGAKVLLVGDWAQLQSVDAGGAFNLLTQRRDNPPELTEVHRLAHSWERTASLDLRHGRTAAIATYIRHDRVHEGSTTQMLDAAYAAWRVDVASGRSSVLVTDARQAVIELNTRARAERILE
nr:AAA family ATPase [Aeromicrobium duanguangcaii]